MLNVVTLLWDWNDQSQWFSRCYDERWVTRLFDGFSRNIGREFRKVLFTERRRDLPIDIMQVLMTTEKPNWCHCIEPYRLDEPMILCGLDTVVTGDCEKLASYCIRAPRIALPRDPYHPERSCNGVALVPPFRKAVWENWRGENDMEWMRVQPHDFIDDIFPGCVASYKGTVQKNGLKDERIVYFHGDQKPHQLIEKEPWIRRHWLGEAA